MLLSWTALVSLLAAAAVAWFWQDSLAAREQANMAAIEACERLSLQFLDGTVAFARIALIRNKGGWLTLRRTYVFDYTANSIQRLQGFVVLNGHQTETVGYASPTPGSGASSPSNAPRLPESTSTSSSQSDSSNVLDLEQWRTSHRRPPPPRRSDREDRGDGWQ